MRPKALTAFAGPALTEALVIESTEQGGVLRVGPMSEASVVVAMVLI